MKLYLRLNGAKSCRDEKYNLLLLFVKNRDACGRAAKSGLGMIAGLETRLSAYELQLGVESVSFL